MTDGAKTVDIETLILSDELSPREALNEQWVVGYAALMADGVRFPPINVMRIEGRRLFPTDGRHRIEARRRCGQTTIEVYIKDGDWDDAVEEAATANACRGLPLSSREKRRAVAMMLAQPKLAQMSDREIARRCGVGHPLVAAIRAERLEDSSTCDNPLETLNRGQEPDLRRGADGKVYDVSRHKARRQNERGSGSAWSNRSTATTNSPPPSRPVASAGRSRRSKGETSPSVRVSHPARKMESSAKSWRSPLRSPSRRRRN
jgi:hypothetical protein